MSGKKKAQKMSLSDFLGDDTKGGSWADDVIDLPTAPAAREDRGNNSYNSRGGFSGERREERRYSGDRGHGDRYERPNRGGFERRERAPRAPVELPSQPPFTAHIGNLSFDCNEDDLSNLFSQLKVSNVKLVRDRDGRSKGFAYVEFEEIDSLKGALELTNEEVHGREIHVNIAEPPRERERVRQPDRTDVDSWRRSGPIEFNDSPRRGGFGGRGGRSDTWGRSNSRDNYNSRDRPAERPRLNLKPRSAETAPSGESARASSGSKPDPFGGAKPVDTASVLNKIEKKHETED
ncbi:MAG: hypothetical protein EXX96DRAFT_559922 [Benjaminiella poitrasii]|nr:MAG: hypothetical protein EXX96DRAFT_559922 [Benjaminiella poitrasii]